MFVSKRGTQVLNVKKRNCGNGCTFNHNICLCPRFNSKRKGDSKSKGSEERSKSERSTKSENVHVAALTVGSNVSHHDQSSEIKYQSVLPTATVMLKGVKRNVVGTRGLLNPCAEKTFVCKSMLNKIKHKVKGAIKLKLHGHCSSIPEKT